MKTKKAGRPKKEIDFKILEGMCGVQCTLKEIASCFNCSEDTIERRCKEETGLRFADFYKKHQSSGKISIRRAQYKLAVENLNPSMLIWLGKQYLDQKDKNEMTDESETAKPVQVKIIVKNARRNSE